MLHSPSWRAAFLAGLLCLFEPLRPQAQDRVEYRFEGYYEDGNRTDVNTSAVYVEKELNPNLVLQGEFIFDSISGATPTGGPPPAGDPQVPLTMFDDKRYAGYVEFGIKQGRFTHQPQFAYSYEHDYKSLGLSFNELIEINKKQTTLAIGLAHNFDQVLGTYQPEFADKGTSDLLLGVTQLLGPRTTLTLNVTLGYNDGYLSDPYKGVNFFYAFPDPSYDPLPFGVNAPENRPGHRFRQVVWLGVNHYVQHIDGALEASFRFGNDDWDVVSQTLALTWFQKLGRRVVLAPQFRFYHQSAANFYATQFEGDPSLPDGSPYSVLPDGTILFPGDPGYPGDGEIGEVPAWPSYYSSDYRLSQLNTFTYGAQVQAKLTDLITLTVTYKRYHMIGTDGITLESAYPSANVITAGFTVWF
ncbi:MAG TPA: DUF3570 domain-containing protein [Verrucomicrobiota bacterium]|nr:hypothetical protein [Verrucomicrobiales bacterium]HRI12517.1 DUF3570 domain-containing protein [Verrucomicrobiota bacterium]